MRVFTNLIHGYYKTFVIISVELCDLSQKLKYRFGLLYSFRKTKISKSSKADVALNPKPKALASTRPGPYDRQLDGLGGGRKRIGGVVAGDDTRCLLLILIV